MSDNEEQFHLKLPARITGIVFWGLVFLGLLVAVVLLEKIESDLYIAQKNHARSLAMEIEEVLESGSVERLLAEKDSPLMQHIDQLRDEMGFTRVQIQHQAESVQWGERMPDDVSIPHTLYFYNRDSNRLDMVTLRIFFPSQKKQLADIRKNMLLGIGLSVLAFGLILQQILQRILSRPFINMVKTAQRFTAGNETVRFDESRQDEFGYLGRFINDAIESMLRHQQELRSALHQVSLSEAALHKEKEFAEVTLQSITESVITIGLDETIQYINPAAEMLLGVITVDVCGQPYNNVVNIVSGASNDVISNPVRECFNTGQIVVLPDHVSLIGGDSSVIAIEATVAPMKNADGDLMGCVIVIKDVSHARRLTRQLSFQASHDMLTGLYNRRKFEDHLEEVLLNVEEESREHSLCYLDLDQFKIVNDTCGHVAGDKLLQQLPVLFNKVLRSGDIIARLGGDEFGVLLENCTLKQAVTIANKLRDQIKAFRFVWEDKTFEIGVSIGIAGINADNTDPAEIMSAADIACYAAKDAGRNRVHVYEPSDILVSERRGQMHWTARITEALEKHYFRLYKQPIVATNCSDQTEHFEILLRMVDETSGQVIPPGAFIPAAERYKLMMGIDKWVINEVFAMVASGQTDAKGSAPDAGRGAMVVSVNLSGESLSDESLLDYILACREKHDISLANICFEITETAAISNINRATRLMAELKNYGCQFALDDFGSGLSSFAYLKNLPVDYLKIDGAFVKDMLKDEVDRAMVSSIQEIARVMHLQTIAECVENMATLALLKEIGVNFVQGYMPGKPEPIVPERQPSSGDNASSASA